VSNAAEGVEHLPHDLARPARGRQVVMVDDGVPLELTEYHADPTTVRRAFYNIAHRLQLIRDAWIAGDREMLDWAQYGTGGSFEEIVKGECRAEVTRIRHDLRTDVFPYALPHADPALRERLVRLMTKLDLEHRQTNQSGHGGPRWRQVWRGTGLQEEIDELVPMLRAAGDAVVLKQASDKHSMLMNPTPSQTKPKQRGGRGTAAKKEAEKREGLIAHYLAEHPEARIREVAGHADCSTSTVSRSKVWQAHQLSRRTAAKQARAEHLGDRDRTI
jgi:hypothetical protein